MIGPKKREAYNSKPPINNHQSNQDINRTFDNLVKGLVAYDIPDEMEIEKDYSATVTITKSPNDEILYQNLDSSNFIKEEIKISSRVKMVLVDPSDNRNFKITPLNTEEQLVDDSTNTVWNWNVRALSGGENKLTLRATVKILDNLGENYKDLTVYYKTIHVKSPIAVTTKTFFSKYWQWLTTVCFIPLLIWVYRKYTERKEKIAKPKPIGFNRDTSS